MDDLFGFVGEAPRLAPLVAVLKGAATGGPLAWGIAREAFEFPIQSVQVDPVVKRLDAARELVETSSCFIGHAGPATSGPLVAGRTALAHKGVVGNSGASALQLERRTTNDSEALLQFVAASHGDLAVRVLAAMQQLPPGPHALLVMQPNVIVSARQSTYLDLIDDSEGSVQARRKGLANAHPLFYAQRQEGTYFCSRRVLYDMHAVEGVMAFRLTADAAHE